MLVEWEGMPREEATWEDWDALVDIYTTEALEDKVLFHEGGDDTTHAERTSSTRLCGAPSWATDFIA